MIHPHYRRSRARRYIGQSPPTGCPATRSSAVAADDSASDIATRTRSCSRQTPRQFLLGRRSARRLPAEAA